MVQGRETTLEEAANLAGYDIYRPSTLGEPSQVWISEGGREVGLRYTEAGLVILLAPWPAGNDVQAALESDVQDLPLAYTTTIGGDPAAVLPYDPDRAVAPVDVVHVVVDGVEVSIYGVHATAGLQGVLTAATEVASA
jgi:hypothetical protein